MLGDNALAEDVAQESFLKLWQNAPRWQDGNAKLLTWLRRVATNACLDRLRKKGPIYSDALPELADERASAEAALHQDQRAARVQKALGRLPDRQRAAISLSYYQEVSQKEGADILGVSQKAYESLLVRARKALRRDLTPVKLEGLL